MRGPSARRGWPVWLAGPIGIGVVLLFVSFSAAAGPGFPLDDGWIHQTYARNLVEQGRWEYVPGATGSGSTAPLWTLLLAVGYLLNIPFRWWAYFLGALSLSTLAWSGMQLWRTLWPDQADRAWLAGLALLLSWQLVWAAASGMETALFLALALTILWLFSRPGTEGGFRLGLLSGLLVLTRPEGLLLILLVGSGLLLRRRPGQLARFIGGALLPLLPYFAANLTLGGELWPNTLYAKQAEYGALLNRPLPLRWLQLTYFSLGGPEEGWRGITGAHLLLVPGLALAGWNSLRADWERRRLLHALPLLWAGGHVLAYAWRLPVTFQHGRYLLPALPVWLLYGLAGWGQLLLQGHGRRARLGARTALLTFLVLLAIFLLLGAQAYAQDVAFVEEEMVDVALWLREETPPGATIAAHDIGAIGYFAPRPLLDLAGLVSPAIVPLLGDEKAIARYVRASNADYLVTAPGWPYPALTTDPNVHLLYQTGYEWTREQGLNNMAVYRLP